MTQCRATHSNEVVCTVEKLQQSDRPKLLPRNQTNPKCLKLSGLSVFSGHVQPSSRHHSILSTMAAGGMSCGTDNLQQLWQAGDLLSELAPLATPLQLCGVDLTPVVKGCGARAPAGKRIHQRPSAALVATYEPQLRCVLPDDIGHQLCVSAIRACGGAWRPLKFSTGCLHAALLHQVAAATARLGTPITDLMISPMMPDGPRMSQPQA